MNKNRLPRLFAAIAFVVAAHAASLAQARSAQHQQLADYIKNNYLPVVKK